jgi:hypothetical protein
MLPAIAELPVPIGISSGAWSGHVIVNPLWLTSNITPILYASVVINGNGQGRTIHSIAASAFRARNPIIFARRFL